MQPGVKAAFILAKQAISKTGGVGLPTFRNDRSNAPGEGAPLPVLSLGCKYLEFQVGTAHPGDPASRGQRRLVFEVQVPSGRILKAYYSSMHYTKGTCIMIRIP